MAAHTLELAQERIAVSIAALKRLLNKPPPSPRPAIKSAFLTTATPPTRNKPGDFKPS